MKKTLKKLAAVVLTVIVAILVWFFGAEPLIKGRQDGGNEDDFL